MANVLGVAELCQRGWVVTVVALLLVGVAGCSSGGVNKVIYTPSETVIEATASIPPDVMDRGKLIQVEKGGQLWESGISMPLFGVGSDTQGPFADVGITLTDPKRTRKVYPLHLGETVALNDYATVTLVSFDKLGTQTQAVTFLFTD